VLLLAACEKGPTEPVASEITIHSGDNQIAPAGSRLSTPLAIRVTDSRGRPVPDVRIRWTVGVGNDNGSVAAETSPSVTDGSGIARVFRTLSGNAGAHTTTAAIDGNAGFVRFTTTAQIQGATQMTLHPSGPGNNQADTVLTTLAPYKVLVRDQNDAPVAGVVVSWMVGSGSLSSATSTTDASGIAEVRHTLGTIAGKQGVQAFVPRLIGSPVRLEVTTNPGNPSGLAKLSGDALGVVNTAHTYAVQATDSHGNAVSGVTIDWAVTSGGGAIFPSRSVTDFSLGRSGAIASHSLGPDESTYTATSIASSILGAPRVTFQVRAVTARIAVVIADDYYCYYGACSASFSPAEVVVPAGKTVGWTWEGEHNVIFEDDPTEPVSSPTKKSGTHFRTFTKPGTYRYRSTLHSTSFTQGMVGTVMVQ
jgi:hypothetical protein